MPLEMIKRIIKLDGSIEPFDPIKLNKWAIWSAADIRDRADWSGVVTKAVKSFGEEVHSQDLQRELIKQCVYTKRWPEALMAGRLYAVLTRKEIYQDRLPSVRKLHDKLIKLGLMEELPYSVADYALIEKIIDHDRDFQLSYAQVKQIRKKYSINNSVKGIEYETPQFVFIRMAMKLAQNDPPNQRFAQIASFYNGFSRGRDNAPSPNFLNLGTPHRGFASCCLVACGDSADSIQISNHVYEKMAVMSAGIGFTIQVRSLGDPVRGGKFKHNGKAGYHRAAGALISSGIAAGRNGAGTAYTQIYDPETVEIMMAQNPRTPVSKQNRDIHFAWQDNYLFARKAALNEQIFTFNCFTAPDLFQALFKGDPIAFEQLYNKYEANPDFEKKYINARDLVLLGYQQRQEVGTLYRMNVDEVNRHTSFIEPIRSSNLCVSYDTSLLTDKGEFLIGDLEGQTVNVWNGQEWSETKVIKTGNNQDLTTVTTSEGKWLSCTAYHKWYLDDGQGGMREVRTHELKIGDKLISYTRPEKYRRLNKTIEEDGYQGTITKIVIAARNGDTYCVSEPKRHMAIFNGILTGQCAEITQPTHPYYAMSDLYSNAPTGFVKFMSSLGTPHKVDYSDKVKITRDGKTFNTFAGDLKEGELYSPVDYHSIPNFKIEKIEEVRQESEISTCSLGGVVVSKIESDEDAYNAAYNNLRMIDECIHLTKYAFPHLEYTAKNRLNAGVGILGLAHHMAKKGLKYDTPEGLAEIDRVMERHMYMLIKASIQLGRERGNAPWIHKTRWARGWLPIDTYKKTVDELVDRAYTYDWEALRAELIEQGGMRFSALCALMPTESSSKAAGAPNGPYPVRDLSLKKTDGSASLDWVAPDNDLYEHDYQLAWEIKPVDQMKFYAVIQKWCDQSVSADTYRDRTQTIVNDRGETVLAPLSDEAMFEEFFTAMKYGVKTQYYNNSFTGGKKMEEVKLVEAGPSLVEQNLVLTAETELASNDAATEVVRERAPAVSLDDLDGGGSAGVGCESGVCTL